MSDRLELGKLNQGKLLKELSTFGIGGAALYHCEARTTEDMQAVIRLAKKEKLPYLVIGKGSNCLFDDRGYRGIAISNKIDFLENPEPGLYHAGAGYSFSLLGVQTARQQWAGLEFASGIPASVGGAVFMNAGANGSETCQTLVSVDYVDDEGTFRVIPKEELDFSYRFSTFQKLKGAITGATFRLAPSLEARTKQLDIIQYRKSTQPYGEKSAGCVFRNPDCGHAGALIDRAGLKGISVGGAKVSEMHANFIVNSQDASCADVLKLIGLICTQVKAASGVDLESEIKVIPYEAP